MKKCDMKRTDKIKWLKKHRFREWYMTHEQVERIVSAEHPMFCVCGRIATEFHESQCEEFKKEVDSRCVKMLEHLIDSYPEELPL